MSRSDYQSGFHLKGEEMQTGKDIGTPKIASDLGLVRVGKRKYEGHGLVISREHCSCHWTVRSKADPENVMSYPWGLAEAVEYGKRQLKWDFKCRECGAPRGGR